jgi:hypothetical protein
MVEGNDEQRIEYNMISEELWWDERRMHGSAEMREKQEEPQLRSSGHARGVQSIREIGRGHVKMQPNTAINRHFEVDTEDGYMGQDR